MSSIDLIRVFQTLGCQDELKCAIASRVCLHLNEVIKVNELEKLYDSELDLLYFRAEPGSFGSEIIIPTSGCKEMSTLAIERIQHKLGDDAKGITIAICHPDSTIIYYNIINDFVDK